MKNTLFMLPLFLLICGITLAHAQPMQQHIEKRQIIIKDTDDDFDEDDVDPDILEKRIMIENEGGGHPFMIKKIIKHDQRHMLIQFMEDSLDLTAAQKNKLRDYKNRMASERINKRIEKMDALVQLNDTQKKQLKDVFLKQHEAMIEAREQDMKNENKKEALKKQHHEQLKTILTPEQLDKLHAHKKRHPHKEGFDGKEKF